MGQVVSCLRGVYHRLGPYFNRRSQIQPLAVITHHKDTNILPANTSHSKLEPKTKEDPVTTTNPFISDRSNSSEEREEEQFNIQWESLYKDHATTSNYKSRDSSDVYTSSTVYCCLIANWSDFNHERHVIKEEVISKITGWSSNRSEIQFIYSDLQEELLGRDHSIETIKLSLHELERITSSDCVVFVIILISDEIGWIPLTSDDDNEEEFINWWPKDVSVLEMELIKARVFTVDNVTNNNVLFMFRETTVSSSSSYQTLTDKKRMKYLQKKIKETYQDQVYTYHPLGVTNTSKGGIHGADSLRLRYEHDGAQFNDIIYDFITNRLQSLFSSHDSISLLQLQTDYQLKEYEKYCQLTSTICHKEHVLSKIHSYINTDGYSPPLLLMGEPGSGRSTLLTSIIQHYMREQYNNSFLYHQNRNQASRSDSKEDSFLYQSQNRNQTSRSNSKDSFLYQSQNRNQTSRSNSKDSFLYQSQNRNQTSRSNSKEDSFLYHHNENVANTWNVFYHYVGKYPRSADLRHILQRVWSIPSLSQSWLRSDTSFRRDSNSLAKEVMLLLSTRNEHKTLLIIDSIDKITDEHSSHILKWLPANFPPNIKLIVSLRPNSIARKVFMSRDPKCKEVSIGSMTLDVSKQLIITSLQKVNINPTTALVNALHDKLSNCNPLYIQEAVSYLVRHKPEEVRGVAYDRTMLSLALSLPEGLSKLHQKSIVDLETSSQGRYIIAALCLIHCSHYGLYESELITLLSSLTHSTNISTELFDFTSPHVPLNHTSCDLVSCDSPKHIKRDTKVWGDYLTVTPPIQVVRHHSATSSGSRSRVRKISVSLSDDEYRPGGEENQFLHPNFISTRRSSSHSLTSEGSPLFSRPVLLPSLKVNSSISLLSSEGGGLRNYTEIIENNSPINDNNDDTCITVLVDHHSTSIEYTTTNIDMNKEKIITTKNSMKKSTVHTTIDNSNKTEKCGAIDGNTNIIGINSKRTAAFNTTYREFESRNSLKTERHTIAINNNENEFTAKSSNEKGTTNKQSLLVGLKRINMDLPSSNNWNNISSFTIASVMRQLGPFLKNTGRPGERRWSLKDSSFSEAVHERYFANAPTQSFPFSFCTSPSFYGADKDQSYYYYYNSEMHPHSSTYSEETIIPISGSVVSNGGGSNASPSAVRRISPSTGVEQVDIVYKRYSWWHARLAGYFSSSAINETRRAEELPYHLSYINDTGSLSHCLVHIPLFERLNTKDNVLDLIHYWQCTGGYCNIGELYRHSLNDRLLQGDIVTLELVKSVALFLCQIEQYDVSGQLLDKRIKEESKGGNMEALPTLVHTLTQVLHQSLIKKEYTSLEEEYNVISIAGKCVQLYRSLTTSSFQKDLATTLLILGQHLITYSSLQLLTNSSSNSNQLSSIDAFTQAHEATLEAKEIYMLLEDHYHHYQSCLQLVSVYQSQPLKAIECLHEAKDIVLNHYGPKCPLLCTVFQEMTRVYSQLLCDKEMAMKYHSDCMELTVWLYGETHPLTISLKEETTVEEHTPLELVHSGYDNRPNTSVAVTVIAEITPP